MAEGKEEKKKGWFGRWFQRRWKWALLFLVEILLLVLFLPGWADFLIMAPSFLLALFGLIYFDLAPNNLWFTFVPEGTAKIVVRGDKFKKALIQWKGYTFDEDWNVIPEGSWTKDGKPLIEKNGKLYKEIPRVKIEREGEEARKVFTIGRKEVKREEAKAPKKEKKHPLGGLRWYGWWPLDDIYIYYFEWWGVKPDGKIVHHSRELLDYILLREDVYYAKVEEAEDYDLLNLAIEFVIPMRVCNPYKALFRIQNWNEAIINRTEPGVRDRITDEPYEELIKKKDAIGRDIYNELVYSGLLTDTFRGEYGVEVRDIQVRNIDPPAEQRDNTLKEFIANQEAKQVRIAADAERYRQMTVGAGEAERVKAVYEQIVAFGDKGTLIRALEALEKSPAEGAKWVIPIPGLANLLGSVFGKPLEGIMPEQFRELKVLLNKELAHEEG